MLISFNLHIVDCPSQSQCVCAHIPSGEGGSLKLICAQRLTNT